MLDLSTTSSTKEKLNFSRSDTKIIVLPYDEHGPTSRFKLFDIPRVPLAIPNKLLLPPVRISLWPAYVQRTGMPEAASNVYDQASAPEHEVGSMAQIWLWSNL